MSTKDLIMAAAGRSVGGKIKYVGGKLSATTLGTNGNTVVVSLTDLTGGLASAPAEGDIVLVYAVFYAGAGNDVFPRVTSTGWTHIDSEYLDCSAYYKVMSATPDTSVTVAGIVLTTGQSQVVMVQCFRGVDPLTPFDVVGSLVTNGNFGSVTPSSADSVICLVTTASWSLNSGITYLDTNSLNNFVQGTAVSAQQRTMGAMGWKKWAGGAYDALPFNYIDGNGTQTNNFGNNYALVLRPKLDPNTITYPYYVNSSYAGSLTGTLPTGVQAGDLMIAYVANNGNRTVSSVPSGWTTRSNLAGIPGMGSFTKTATSSEPSTYSFGLSGSASRTSVTIAVYRNAQVHAVSTTAPFPPNFTITPTTVYDLMVNCTVDDVSTNGNFTARTSTTVLLYGTGGCASVLSQSAGVLSPTRGNIHSEGTGSKTVNIHLKPL